MSDKIKNYFTSGWRHYYVFCWEWKNELPFFDGQNPKFIYVENGKNNSDECTSVRELRVRKKIGTGIWKFWQVGDNRKCLRYVNMKNDWGRKVTSATAVSYMNYLYVPRM